MGAAQTTYLLSDNCWKNVVSSIKTYAWLSLIQSTDNLSGTLVYWLPLCFCDPQVAGSNPVRDGQGYELFEEIALISVIS